MSAVLKNAFVRQFQRPSGPFGVLAGRVMARKNLDRTRWVAGEMAIAETDRVLEIGHGPGVAIEEVFRRVPGCSMVGIDPSIVMHRQARSRNRIQLASGNLRLETCSAEAFETSEASFDLVFAINVLAFCVDPADVVCRAASWLAPGGRMVVVHQVPMRTVDDAQLDVREKQIRGWLENAGLCLQRINRLPAQPNPVHFLEAALEPAGGSK